MEYVICLWITCIGAILGSFLGCMGYRIPNKIKTTYPSSFCSSCKKSLKWYMNIPIISYIVLKGKCSYCKKKIGFIYFLCEILGAILFLGSYLLFGFTEKFFLLIILTCALIVTIVSDFLYYYISDRVLIMSYFSIIIVYLTFRTYEELFGYIGTSIIIFLVMIGIKVIGNQLFKKESLGDGDIKLMAVLGLSLGLLNSFVSLFVSSCIALIYSIIVLAKNKEGVIPFGPFLIMGTMIVISLSNYIQPFLIEYLSI
jgi:prepilin signal peptidase PulO-like enzyme (type II secretory pathway)